MKFIFPAFVTLFFLLLTSCSLLASFLPESGKSSYPSCFDLMGQNNEWSNESHLEIVGYEGNAMEPRISGDQNLIFFNDKGSDDDQMDIHYAVRPEPLKHPNRFIYKGKLSGVNESSRLDGTPGLDKYGNFYFVSLREYPKNFQSIFAGRLVESAGKNFQVVDVKSVDANVTRAQKMMIDMDGEVSWDGRTMICSRADFKVKQAGPHASYLALFDIEFNNGKSTLSPKPNKTSSYTLANVNLPECRVYAGAMSENNLELYYTALPVVPDAKPNDFRILVAKRKIATEPFGRGEIIDAIKGDITEGPTLSISEGKSLYYHKWDNTDNRFKLYKVTRN